MSLKEEAKKDLNLTEMLIESAEEQKKAHEEWLKEKEEVLKKLQYARIQLDAFGYNWCIERSNDLKEVIDFIEKGEI